LSCLVRSALVGLVLAATGCGVRVPSPPGLTIALKTNVRAQVRAQAQVQGQAQGQGQGVAEVPAPVAIENAPVVEFFGIPLEGAYDVVFVLDRSGSMDEPAQGAIAQVHASAPAAPPDPPPAADPPPPPPPSTRRKIDVAKDELVEALQRLPAGTRMNVIFFNSSLAALSATMVPLDEAQRPTIVTFVRGTEPSGSTALAPAMRTAFLMNASRIVLLSDGLGNVGGDAGSLLRDAREAMRGGVRIDTIGLGNDQDRELLNALATESGGLYQAL
jgi:Mg-chelatase subunit ChlD